MPTDNAFRRTYVDTDDVTRMGPKEIYESLASAYSGLTRPSLDTLTTFAATWLGPRYVKDHRYHIKKVIFNDPATIIIWFDGSKTVVKCGEEDAYDPEKGMAMAIAKRFLGDKGNYYNVFKKWLPEDYEGNAETVSELIMNKNGAMSVTVKKMKKKSGLTVKEYAEKYGVSVRTVYRMIKADEVYAKKDSAGKWLIYGN